MHPVMLARPCLPLLVGPSCVLFLLFRFRFSFSFSFLFFPFSVFVLIVVVIVGRGRFRRRRGDRVCGGYVATVGRGSNRLPVRFPCLAVLCEVHQLLE